MVNFEDTYIITNGKHTGSRVKLTAVHESKPGKEFYSGYLVERPLTSVFLNTREFRAE